MKTLICKHCGQPIQKGETEGEPTWYHPTVVGKSGSGIGRCQTGDKVYGYNAEPIGEPCRNPCLGTVQDDEKEYTE